MADAGTFEAARSRLDGARTLAPGILLSLTVAAAAGFVADHYGGPVMLMALLIGMALAFLSEGPRAAPGIRFSSGRILRVGVALLGLRIAVSDVVGLGPGVVGLVLSGIAIAIAAGILAAPSRARIFASAPSSAAPPPSAGPPPRSLSPRSCRGRQTTRATPSSPSSP